MDAASILDRDSNVVEEIRALGAKLSQSSTDLYNLLDSCRSNMVRYSEVLRSFDLVADDYDALIKANGSYGYDLGEIYETFNSLARALR